MSVMGKGRADMDELRRFELPRERGACGCHLQQS